MRTAPSLDLTGAGGAPSPASPEAQPILISGAVSKYATDNAVPLADVTGTGKDGRIVKADITAILQTRSAPTIEPEETDPFALDAEPAAAPVAATKEDVRDALVGYQTTLRESLIADGTAVEDAKRDAMVKARSLLEDMSGATTLGGLAESDYAKIVAAADAAKAAL